MRRSERVLACVAMIALSAPVARAEAPPRGPGSVFDPSTALDLAALESLVRERSPALEGAALEVELRAGEVRQSRLLANPELDATWGAIPIGETNPKDLERPFANVPYYDVGLSYTFPLGKRGPTIGRARALERAARADYEASVREAALALSRNVGTLATVTLRREGLAALVEDGERAVSLAEKRLGAMSGTPLELDRLRIELSRSRQQALEAESALAGALAACASAVRMPCRGFASGDEARAYLERWIRLAGTRPEKLENRPDLRALDAYREAATAEASLARAQRIPDPTVRLGYTHDRFLVSGNQMNSLSVSVSLPLPLFDQGQAQLEQAEARRARAASQRRKILQATRTAIPLLKDRIATLKQRQQLLATDVIPRAKGVLRDLEVAFEGRLIPLADIIQARRTVNELLVEEAESYAAAFEAALELLALQPERPAADSAHREDHR